MRPLLSAVELVILQLLLLGYSSNQVATLLDMEPHEIHETTARLVARVGASDWRAAAAELVRRGVIGAR